MITLALANRKGGVGKTTISVNLSAAIAREGRPTLLIDLDPQMQTSQSLGVFDVNRAASSGAVLVHDTDPASAIIGVKENLALIPAHPDMTALPGALATEHDRDTLLARALSSLEGFAYCVIDCPPSLDVLSANGLVAADYVLIPVVPEPLVWAGLQQLLNTIRDIREFDLNPRLKIGGVIINRPARTRVGQDVVDLINDAPVPVMRTTIPQNVRLQEAQAAGITVFDLDPTCPAAVAFTSLAREVIAWETNAPAYRGQVAI